MKQDPNSGDSPKKQQISRNCPFYESSVDSSKRKAAQTIHPSVLVGEAVMVGTLMTMEDLFLICNNSHIDAIVQY